MIGIVRIVVDVGHRIVDPLHAQRARLARRDLAFVARVRRVAGGAERHGMREDRGAVDAHGSAALEIAAHHQRRLGQALHAVEKRRHRVRLRLLDHAPVGPVHQNQAAHFGLADLRHELAVLPGTRIGRRAVKRDEDQLRHFVAQVMVFIQRRTVEEALSGGTGFWLAAVALRGVGGGGRASGARRRGQRQKYRKQTRTREHHASSVTDFRYLPIALTRALERFLRAGRLAQRAVHQAFHRAHQVGRFVGALGDHRIGAGILLGEPQRLHKTGEQNDPCVRIQHANPLDQLPAVHARHAVIRHNHVELGGLEEFQALFSVGRDLYATSDLFQ